jgi:hypothetical protein
VRLLRAGFPDDPALDVAVGHALLERAARGEIGPTVRVYRPGATCAFGRLDTLAPGFGAAVAAARAHGPVELPEGILAALGTLPVEQIAAALGLGGGGGLPERMAAVNSLLNGADPEVRQRLLVAFLSLLQRPSPRP